MTTPPTPPASPAPASRAGLIEAFARHPVACNLLMAIMLLVGAAALTRLNTQTYPDFDVNTITVRMVWSGATPEDVEAAITAPLERELLNLGGLKDVTSWSRHSVARLSLSYDEGADMAFALEEVKERVASIRNLPASAEEPVISRVVRYEPVARLLVTGDDRRSLRPIVRRIERELLDRGIAKIDIDGLPPEEVAVAVPSAALRELDVSLAEIARRIAALSLDLPAGNVGRDGGAKQLRALEQRRRAIGFEDLPLLSGDDGRLVTLGDVASVERRARGSEALIFHEGRPAVNLRLRRARGSGSLESARILHEWLDEQHGRWPPGVEVLSYDESWEQIRKRTLLLVENGAGGLLLVVAILFLFLNGRIAFWVAVGIPTSFMAALGALWAMGGSINMVSLMALIITVGIIVDDAIVVGEDAFVQYRAGAGPLASAQAGARRMLAPVLSSSLTTIAAFLPLMLVGGTLGTLLFAIPLVVICVILASLVESFLVLPGHLSHGFRRISGQEAGALRRGLDRGFERFRDGVFRPLVTAAVGQPWTTLSCALAALLLCVGLVRGERLAFHLFPQPETAIVNAEAKFISGTSPARVERFTTHLVQALRETEAHFGESLVKVTAARIGELSAQLLVELVEPDERETRNPALLAAWRERIERPPGLESLALVEQRDGPSGRDIVVNLTGDDAGALKAAALDLASALAAAPGVSGVEDDMPFGQEQLVYRLTPQAKALGLTVAAVGEQLRAAYDGHLAQIFQHEGEELEVRVVLPDEERHDLASLGNMSVMLPEGGAMPLLSAVEIEPGRGFDGLRHHNGRLAVKVSADVDPGVNSSNAVMADLWEGPLPAIVERHGVKWGLGGGQEQQSRILGDMALGAVLGLALIYLVLAFVFASYGWPLVVMSVIPFGLIGAVFGHWLLGIDLTILSMFGLFGLAGIVVNDSIILIVSYKELKQSGAPWREAIVEAACLRLRAVLLTSLTTIGGLTPLMFETSLQAQYLVPMAVSIAFGLGVATFLVLLLVPALLCLHEAVATRWEGRAARAMAGTG